MNDSPVMSSTLDTPNPGIKVSVNYQNSKQPLHFCGQHTVI